MRAIDKIINQYMCVSSSPEGGRGGLELGVTLIFFTNSRLGPIFGRSNFFNIDFFYFFFFGGEGGGVTIMNNFLGLKIIVGIFYGRGGHHQIGVFWGHFRE